jgi:hypothetical protein
LPKLKKLGENGSKPRKKKKGTQMNIGSDSSHTNSKPYHIS